MASRSAAAPRFRLMPEQVAAYLKRRAVQGAGLLVGIVALALALALLSFDANDPSYNHATTGGVANLMGRAGAYGADILFSWIGFAVVVPVLVLAAWAWRLMAHQHLARPWFGLVALPFATAILALAFQMTGWPADWPFSVGPGGIVGATLYGILVNVGLVSFIGLTWLAIGFGLFGIVLFVLTAGLPRDDVRRAAGGLWFLTTTAAHGLWRGSVATAVFLRGLYDRLPERNRDDLEDEYEEEAYSEDDEEYEEEAEVYEDEEAFEEEVEAETPPPKRRVRPRKDTAKKRKRRKPQQTSLALDGNGVVTVPPLELLTDVDPNSRNVIDDEALEQNARMLEGVLQDFGIRGEIDEVRPGPVVTLYELEPEAGIRASRVIGLADDIARNMSAISARVSVVPGRTVLGIELPNADRETVALRELLEAPTYTKSGTKLPIALGKEISGAPVVEDLAHMPHLLVAGTTGSGKSVAINAMILSLLYKMTPDQCRLILIDPKMLELSVYDDIPHLLAPVVTEPGKAVVALKWTVREMENRYRSMQKIGVRNIDGFNKRVAEAQAKGLELTRTVQTGFNTDSGEPVFEEEVIADKPLPYIVVVVDEMADLMLVAGRDIEGAIQRLAQMARAAGIHLIMATQRPSVDVITGTIKANFPCRVSFHVTSKIDSRTILGEQGAEQLLGKGDMLFMRGGGRVTRIHGPFVGDDEVQQVADFLRRQGKPDYLDDVTEEAFEMPSDMGGGGFGGDAGNDKDKALYDQAVFLVTKEQKASTSFIQRHLKIGYNRAATIIERMEADGVVSAANHVGKREVLAAAPPEL